MTSIDRINRLLKYLGFNSMRAFALELGLNPQIFYDIKADKCGISREVANRIQEKFKTISVSWLIGGEGNMIIGEQRLHNESGVLINGDNNSPIDNRHYYSDSPDVLRAQIDFLEERIKEKDAQIKEKDAQIKEKDAQIKELLSILSKR